MKKIFTSMTIIALGFTLSNAALASTQKSVIIVNNNQTPINVTYSSCDKEGTFCEYSKTKTLAVGEKLLIK